MVTKPAVIPSSARFNFNKNTSPTQTEDQREAWQPGNSPFISFEVDHNCPIFRRSREDLRVAESEGSAISKKMSAMEGDDKLGRSSHVYNGDLEGARQNRVVIDGLDGLVLFMRMHRLTSRACYRDTTCFIQIFGDQTIFYTQHTTDQLAYCTIIVFVSASPLLKYQTGV